MKTKLVHLCWSGFVLKQSCFCKCNVHYWIEWWPRATSLKKLANIRDRVGVAPIEEKLTQHRLRWFGRVQRRAPKAPVCSGVLKRVDNVKRGRGRPKLTWDKSVKRDLKKWNISKEVALDRSAWRLAINVPEPWPLFLLGSISNLPQLCGQWNTNIRFYHFN